MVIAEFTFLAAFFFGLYMAVLTTEEFFVDRPTAVIGCAVGWVPLTMGAAGAILDLVHFGF